MQRRYRKFVLSLYRKFRHPRVLKNNRFRRWFARHFLDKTVWKPTRHTFAGGIAVGAFAMMLVIPGQMGVAFALAALLRVNIPIAMLVTWITNPVTNLRFTQSFVEALGPGRVLGVGNDDRYGDSEFGSGLVHCPSLRLSAWNFTGGAAG